MSGIQEPKSVAPVVSYLRPEEWCEGGTLCLLELGMPDLPVPFQASRFSLAPGASSPVDQHSVREMWFIASGAGKLIFDGSEHDVVAGHALYFPSGKTHQITNCSDSELVVFSVWWK